jgi:hypothetical protein
MSIVSLALAGGIGVILYNVYFSKSMNEPQPGKTVEDDKYSLPPPRTVWTNPSQFTSSPYDVTYLPSYDFFGPLNDPRKAYILPGGTRITHSGYNPVGRTNQVWDSHYYLNTDNNKVTSDYKEMPLLGLGESRSI